MNLVFAVICLSAVLWIFGIEHVRVVDVTENSPAVAAGIQSGDIITRVDDKDVILASDFPAIVQDYKGETIDVVFERNGKELNTQMIVNEEYVEDMGFTGILFESSGLYHLPLIERPFKYTYLGFQEGKYWTVKTVESFATLFAQLGQGQKPEGIAGPLGITLTISEILRYGAYNTFRFMAIISINLAIINIVPFPPLDGSRVMLLVVEAVIGKKHVSKFEHRVLEFGMIVLLLLILLLTITEVPKLIQAGSVSAFVDQLFGAAN